MVHNSLNLNFNLRKPTATSPTPINLVVRYNNEKFTYPTAEHIVPKTGDKTKKGYQRAKANAFNNYSELNARLDNIANTVTNVYRKYKNDNQNEVPTVAFTTVSVNTPTSAVD